MRGGQEHRDERAVGGTENGRALRPGRVEDSRDIFHLRLEVRQLVEGHRIRQSRPSTVEVDQPPEGAEPAQEASEVGEVPDRLDVVHPRIHQQDVERPRPDGLVREVHVSVPRELGPRLLGHASGV